MLYKTTLYSWGSPKSLVISAVFGVLLTLSGCGGGSGGGGATNAPKLTLDELDYEDSRTISTPSTPGVDSFSADEQVTFALMFSEQMKVVEPYPKVMLDIGGQIVVAEFEKVEGNEVHFSFTVAEGMQDTDGEIAIASIESPSSIQSIAGTVVEEGEIQDSVSLKVDARAPTVLSFEPVDSPANYGIGDNIRIKATFSEEVDLRSATAGDYLISLNVGGSLVDAQIESLTNRDNVTTAVFTFAAASYNDANGLDINSHTMADHVEDQARLALSSTIAASANKLNTVVIDTVRPTLKSGAEVQLVDSSGASTATTQYKNGETLYLKVTFSENVTIGTLNARMINTGYSNLALTKVSTTNNSILYKHTVSGLTTEIYNDVSIDIYSGSATDGVGNELAKPVQWSIPGLLISPYDAVTITSITEAPAGDGTYKGGETLTFHITFNQDITVDTPSPVAQLSIGGQTVNAAYQSLSGTNTLVFSYTVALPTPNILDTDDSIELTGITNGTSITTTTGGFPFTYTSGNVLGNVKVINFDPQISIIEPVDSVGNRTYGPNETVGVKVNFNQPVNFASDTTGDYSLDLSPDSGGTITAYPLATTDGVSVVTFSFNTGTSIIDTAGGLDLASHNLENNLASLIGETLLAGFTGVTNDLDDVVIDAVIPYITQVEPVDPAGNDRNYGANEDVQIRVHFSEAVDFSSDTTGDYSITLATEVGGPLTAYPVATTDGVTSAIFQFNTGTGVTENNGGPGLQAHDLQNNLLDSIGNAVRINFTGATNDLDDITIDTTEPYITLLEPVDTVGNRSYGSNEVVQIRVHFSEAVDFSSDTTGDYSITLILDSGTKDAYPIATTDDVTTAIFAFNTGANATDITDGLGLSAHDLQNNIVDQFNNTLRTDFTGATNDLDDITIDTSDPYITIIEPVDGVGDRSYQANETVQIRVHFNEEMDFSSDTTGDYSITLALDSNGPLVAYPISTTDGVTSVIFEFNTGNSGARDVSGGLGLQAHNLHINMVDDSNNSLLPNFPDVTNDLDDIIIDTTDPYITLLEPVDAAGSDRAYAANEDVQIRVHFSEEVDFSSDTTGDYALTLTLDSGDQIAYPIATTDNVTSAIFRFNTGTGTTDVSGGLELNTHNLQNNIIDIVSNALRVNFTDATNDLGDITIDTTNPHITLVEPVDPAGEDRRYGKNATVQVRVHFSEAVHFNSDTTGDYVLSLALDNGTQAAYPIATTDDVTTAIFEFNTGTTATDVSGGLGLQSHNLQNNLADSVSNALTANFASATNNLSDITIDTTEPYITLLEPVDGVGSRSYGSNEEVQIRVHFSETIDFSSDTTGDYSITLILDNGTKDAYPIATTDGVTTAIFAFNTGTSSTDLTDGLGLSAHDLQNNITDLASNTLRTDFTDATNDLDDITIDTSDPYITIIEPVDGVGDRSYSANEDVQIRVHFSETIDFSSDTTGDYSITLGVDFGGPVIAYVISTTDDVASAIFQFNTGTSITDVSGGLELQAHNLQLNIVDDTNNTVVPNFPDVTNDLDDIIIDTSDPYITRIEPVDPAGDDRAYGANEDVQVRVHFSESVDFSSDTTGDYALTLTLDSGDQIAYPIATTDDVTTAIFEFNTGTTATDVSGGLDLNTHNLQNNVIDQISNALVAGFADTTNDLGDITIDTTNPHITLVEPVDPAGEDRRYGKNATVQVRVHFSEAVHFDSDTTGDYVLSLALDNGTQAAYPIATTDGVTTAIFEFNTGTTATDVSNGLGLQSHNLQNNLADTIGNALDTDFTDATNDLGDITIDTTDPYITLLEPVDTVGNRSYGPDETVQIRVHFSEVIDFSSDTTGDYLIELATDEEGPLQGYPTATTDGVSSAVFEFNTGDTGIVDLTGGPLFDSHNLNNNITDLAGNILEAGFTDATNDLDDVSIDTVVPYITLIEPVDLAGSRKYGANTDVQIRVHFSEAVDFSSDNKYNYTITLTPDTGSNLTAYIDATTDGVTEVTFTFDTTQDVEDLAGGPGLNTHNLNLNVFDSLGNALRTAFTDATNDLDDVSIDSILPPTITKAYFDNYSDFDTATASARINFVYTDTTGDITKFKVFLYDDSTDALLTGNASPIADTSADSVFVDPDDISADITINSITACHPIIARVWSVDDFNNFSAIAVDTADDTSGDEFVYFMSGQPTIHSGSASGDTTWDTFTNIAYAPDIDTPASDVTADDACGYAIPEENISYKIVDSTGDTVAGGAASAISTYSDNVGTLTPLAGYTTIFEATDRYDVTADKSHDWVAYSHNMPIRYDMDVDTFAGSTVTNRGTGQYTSSGGDGRDPTLFDLTALTGSSSYGYTNIAPTLDTVTKSMHFPPSTSNRANLYFDNDQQTAEGDTGQNKRVLSNNGNQEMTVYMVVTTAGYNDSSTGSDNTANNNGSQPTWFMSSGDYQQNVNLIYSQDDTFMGMLGHFGNYDLYDANNAINRRAGINEHKLGTKMIVSYTFNLANAKEMCRTYNEYVETICSDTTLINNTTNKGLSIDKLYFGGIPTSSDGSNSGTINLLGQNAGGLRLHEFIIYGDAHTATDRDAILGVLTQKWQTAKELKAEDATFEVAIDPIVYQKQKGNTHTHPGTGTACYDGSTADANITFPSIRVNNYPAALGTKYIHIIAQQISAASAAGPFPELLLMNGTLSGDVTIDAANNGSGGFPTYTGLATAPTAVNEWEGVCNQNGVNDYAYAIYLSDSPLTVGAAATDADTIAKFEAKYAGELSHKHIAKTQYTPLPVEVAAPTLVQAAYSLRRIIKSYSGPLVQVQIGGFEFRDIYHKYDASGGVELLDITSMIAESGNPSADVIVSRWYDQSGNGRHVELYTGARPRIAVGGAIRKQRAKPVVYFDEGRNDALYGPVGTNFTGSTDYLYVFMVYHRLVGSEGQMVFNLSYGGSGGNLRASVHLPFESDDRIYWDGGHAANNRIWVAYGTATSTQQYTFISRDVVGNDLIIRRAGANIQTGAGTSYPITTLARPSLGRGNTHGQIGEFIVYTHNAHGGVSSIETFQENYWGTP